MSRRRARADEAGYVAIVVALLSATILLPLAAISVDVARWYVEISRVQNAADAAALAGVTYLPDNLPGATSAALAAATANGFPASSSIKVSTRVGATPSQLVVTVTSTIRDTFSGSFSDGFTTITRTATADYNGPAPMGSPCNTFGNEPDGTPGAGPVASQLVAPTGATCPRTPQFWGNVHGPNVLKTQGDQFQSRSCAGGEDGCAGSTNTEYDPLGYFLVVRVGAAAVGKVTTVQLYDPAYVATGSRCTATPTGTVRSDDSNDYATTDAKTRYAVTASGAKPNAFCAGDDPNGDGTRVGSSEVATVTSYALRRPVDTYRPRDGAPEPGCSRQYPGYVQSDVTAGALRRGSSSYNAALAAVFHQWVPLCTFTPTKAGDYYLQVRTNVPLGGTADGRGGYAGSTAIFTQTGDNSAVKGNGSNRFAVRAISSAAGAVSVAGWESMSLFANTDAATTTFNLVRVIPAAAGKTLIFTFFDAGDAASNGTIKVLPPTEYHQPLTSCVGAGVRTGALAGCQITGISSANGWNGRTQTIRVSIPPGYTCTSSSPGGCWFQVQVSFGTGTVTDVTTWSAVVEGDPVRLIQ